MDASLEHYRRMLAIDKHSLDDELEQQSVIMDQISQKVLQLTSQMAKAKEDLLRLEARLLIEMHESYSKVTTAMVDAGIKRNRERQVAWEAYNDARAAYDEWDALRDAWKQRGFSIKTLADLYTSNYFSADSIHDRKDRDRSRIDRYQKENTERRAALTSARQQMTSRRRLD